VSARHRVVAAASLLLGAAALTGFASVSAPDKLPAAPTPDKLPAAPAPGDLIARFPDSPSLRAQGASLYVQGCASCHGFDLRGRAGIAPSLRAVGAGPVDFYLSTGRMPLATPREQPDRSQPLYSRLQIDALIDYVSASGGPAAPSADPSRGSLGLGFQEFTLNCAGCHQIVGRGGLTIEARVPNLQSATARQIAEAVRMGPYVMPRFSSWQIDQHELDSIVRYVLWTRHPDNAGGWGIGNLGPIPEGWVAWFIALAAMVIVARLIGERAA
jgi:ubiquinol-cytochrome c reductase cytochrome c subunit